MRDIRQIVRFWRERNTSVLVTLVGVEGSTYRQPGAHLLLGTNGDWAGAISGGCLEKAVAQQAKWKVSKGAVVERYSTQFDDLSDMPYGSGCGGIVDLLMEPTNTQECKALMNAMEAALAGEESTILTWLPTETSKLSRAILGPTGQLIYRSAGLHEDAIWNASGKRWGITGTSSRDVFTKHLKKPQCLFILGAGDDAKPLSSMAALLGWSVIVMDGRSHLARPDRFPDANRVSVISSASAAARDIQPDDAVVLMTHSFDQDRNLLAAILPLKPKYLGLLGARRRSSLLVAEAAAKLGRSLVDCCDQVHAPIGLNLGGDGAEAIALAVVAEIQACCMGNLPSSRKLSPFDVERCARLSRQPDHRQPQCALDVA